MIVRRIVGLLGAALLAGACTTQRPPSAYDLFADRFGPDGESVCERVAYETGRQRFEFQTGFSGQAWAGYNANIAAEAAFERCLAARPVAQRTAR